VKRWAAATALLLVLPGGAQQPRPFFSLNTDRTYAPGETPVVRYAAENVDALEFRAYRVNDPVEFFRRLPAGNQFGGQAPPSPPARTLLERIHQWKQRTRFAMRRFVRHQFGDEEHHQLTNFFGRAPRAKPAGQGGERYAEVPLLNPQQLVRTWRVPIDPKPPWDTRVTKVEVPGPGTYIVEAVAQGLRAATIVNVTPLAILTKAAPGLLVAQAVDRATGFPVRATFHLIGAEAKTFASDASGMIRANLASGDESEYRLVAINGGDAAFASVQSWALRRRQDAIAMGYVYTDRPIYRPGDKVGFRAILRGEDDKGWTMPEAEEIACELADPEGQVVDRRTLRLSKFGTVSGDWKIPANAPLGYYTILLRAGEARQAGSFQVEEYRKPEYEVKVRAAEPRILQPRLLEFTVEARYFFGEPVANGRVRYTVRRSRHWSWFDEDFDPEDFGEEGDPSFYGEQIAEGEARLNAEGVTTIRFPTRLHDFDEDYRVEARVMDEAKREIAGRGAAFASVGNFVLQARPAKYVYAPGETVRVEVKARDYDGRLVPGVPVTMASARAVTNAEGIATIEFPAPATGNHKIPVKSGRVSDTVYLWVSGVFSEGPDRGRVTLAPEKRSYRVGETARVLVVTGVPEAQVLLGLESRALHAIETKRVSESSFVYEFPVRAEHMPNVFLSAAFLKDGVYHFGSKSIPVPPKSKLLQVDVQPSKPQFKPGEPARYVVTARDSEQRPVAAEVSLGVVDEAVYGVAPDTTPRIDRAFYGRTYDRVFTASSLSFYFYGQAGERAMPIARANRKTLAQMKPPSPNDPRVRKAFPDTAYWSPSLVTGANGRAEVVMQFPDSITAWRATARAVTPDTRVGAAVNRVITRKDLILRLAAPRFLTQGDEAEISAIVNNYLGETKKVRVALETKGLEILGAANAEGEAAANRETRFDFRVRAGARGAAAITAKAITDAESDALAIDLPIRPYGVRRTIAQSGAGPATARIVFPNDAEERALEIRAMPSLVGAIFGALDYLTTFPYGCTEQTLSSFVPNAMAERALRELNLPGASGPQLRKQIRAGLARLAELQHPDGGWGFWESDDSGAFMTANVVAALDEFGDWGRIDRERARAWLARAFEKETRAHPDFRAFLAYAINDPKAIDPVWPLRDQMTPQGLALLGLRLDGSRAAEVASRLEQSVTAEGYWRSDRDTLMDLAVDNSAEATARAVKFLTQTKPDSPAIRRAVEWLATHRADGYYWSSTKQTAAVVDALTGFLKQSGELDPKLAVEVKVNGASVWNKELTRQDALSAHPAGFLAEPKPRDNAIEFLSSGRGNLYWSATGVYYSLARPPEARGGLRIDRQYLRELSGQTYAAFDGAAQPGEVIVSRLSVSGGDFRYLVIEDPIPAGFELMKDFRAYWTHRENRDDRAVIFETFFSGRRQYEVKMKAVRPGKYRVSPASAAPMYQPGADAISDPAAIEVRP
jgi:uncharacterized protein YfaS (alpha-2-macroglobulin family)